MYATPRGPPPIRLRNDMYCDTAPLPGILAAPLTPER